MRFKNGLVAIALAGSLTGCNKSDFSNLKSRGGDYQSFEDIPLEVVDNISDPGYSHIGVSIDDNGVKYFDFSFMGGNNEECRDWRGITEDAVLKLRTAKVRNSKVTLTAYPADSETHANGVYELRAIGSNDFSTINFPRSNTK